MFRRAFLITLQVSSSNSRPKVIGLPTYIQQKYAYHTKNNVRTGKTRSEVGKQIAQMAKAFFSRVSDCLFGLLEDLTPSTLMIRKLRQETPSSPRISVRLG